MSAQSVLDWVIQTGFSVSLLILIVMLIRKPVARRLGAPTAYALWALPVIRLVMPALPLLPAKTRAPMPTDLVVTNFENFVFTPEQILSASETSASSFAPVVISIWLGGAILWLVWLAIRQARFNADIEKSTTTASLSIQAMVDDIAHQSGLRRVPEIRQARDSSGPLVAGLSRPVMVLPAQFETEFTDDEKYHAIAHELSHLRFGDLWISAAALVFRAVNWPNPLVHLAAPQFRADQESACDARVIALLGDDRSTKTAYADTLIKAARLSNNPAQKIMAPTMPLGLTISNPLKERLMILTTNPKKHRGLRAALAGTAALALLVTAPLTNAQTPPDTPALPDTEIVGKKVMKWVTNENGVETNRHIEIITENGETTAWEIDEIGNRIQVPVESLNMPKGFGLESGEMRVVVKSPVEGTHMSDEEIEVFIAETLEGIDIEALAGADGHQRVIMKRMDLDGELMTEGVFGGSFEVEVDENGEDRKVIIMENHSMMDISGDMMKSKPGIMVDAASGMLENIDTSDMDSDVRRKVEKAQKALREAQEALAEAE